MKAEEITAFEANIIHKPVRPGEFSWDEYINTCAQSCGLLLCSWTTARKFLNSFGAEEVESILEIMKLSLSKWSISPGPAPSWWNGCCVLEQKFVELWKFQEKSFSPEKAAFQTHSALGILLQVRVKGAVLHCLGSLHLSAKTWFHLPLTGFHHGEVIADNFYGILHSWMIMNLVTLSKWH